MTELASAEALDLMQLAQPEPVAMWPDTPAWYVLFALLMVTMLVYLWRHYRLYQKALWRRQALALAQHARLQAQADVWFTLIKRAYLVHHTKQALAAMTDAELLKILPGLDHAAQQELQQAHYQKAHTLTKQTNSALHQAVISWVNGLPQET